MDYAGLSVETNLSVRELRTLAERRQIPFLKLGWRTIRFQPSKVFEALSKFEIKPAVVTRVRK